MTLLSVSEAKNWAVKFTGKEVTTANISYLINYALIKNYGNNKEIKVSLEELRKYYDKQNKELAWKKKIGSDLNWNLSFDEYKESERTKHVHRLHPYKGKFIPQLVEYFIDSHIDEFKSEIYFKPGDLILDPFCGSGTTLIEANEKRINAIGIDISEFNALISNTKLLNVDFWELSESIKEISFQFNQFVKDTGILEFDQEILAMLSKYNKRYFPSPEFKWQVKNKTINEYQYANKKLEEILHEFYLINTKYDIKIKHDNPVTFIDKWFIPPVKKEINFLIKVIRGIDSEKIRNILTVILSRTIRSCRATTHSDLATLQKPVYKPYYCRKHRKICKPIFSISYWWSRYSKDTVNRFLQFSSLRSNTLQHCLIGDARTINIEKELESVNPKLGNILNNQKIKGIFSSPPYVGLINYHEQHQYAYDFFGFQNRQDSEIGPLFKGKGKQAQKMYVNGVAEVLINCKKYLAENYDVFLVANDKFDLYKQISKIAGMQIVKEYKRPVLNRTEKDKSKYSETIFHLKEK